MTIVCSLSGTSCSHQFQQLINRYGWGEPDSAERWNIVTGGGYFMGELPDQLVTPEYWDIKGKYQDAVKQQIEWKIKEYGQRLTNIKSQLRNAAVKMSASELESKFLQKDKIMTIQEFMKNTYRCKRGEFQSLRPLLVCEDGFDMSVQASKAHGCSPRMDGNIEYYSVEIGYPSCEEELLIPYAYDKDDLTNTIYAYVPVNIVNQVIDKHGGIKK